MILTADQRLKIRRFLDDPSMAEAVFNVMRSTFMKPRAKLEVTTLAAERIAINLLDDAFKELERVKKEIPSGTKAVINDGV